MIYESYPWKQDLQRRKNLLLRYNRPEQFAQNFDRACTVIEKAILYSAFIIRKLINCDRLSTEADEWTMQVKKYAAVREFNRIHHSINEGSHDWENAQNETIKAHKICNWLIHSYIFDFIFDAENQRIESFAVASDFDRNEVLYVINVSDWVRYMNFVATDYVTSRRCILETVPMSKGKKAVDYVSKIKERGQ